MHSNDVSKGPSVAVSPDGRNEIRVSKNANGMFLQVFRDGRALTAPSPVGIRISGAADATLELAATNEGVAYRFRTEAEGDLTVECEQADIRALTPEQSVCIAKVWREWHGDVFQNSWESPAVRQSVEALASGADALYFGPVLFEFDGAAMAATDSDVRDYPGWNFRRDETDAQTLRGVFAPFPREIREDQNGDLQPEGAARGRQRRIVAREPWLVQTHGPRTFPWRCFLLADNPVGLIGNGLVRSLAAPCRLTDTSWIRPGQVAWDWWNDWNLTDVDFTSGCDTRTYEHYIDFAAANGIAYVILDEGWSHKLDIWTPNPAVDVPHLTRYGRERGVGIVLWAAWGQIEGLEERAVKHFADLGAAGVKVDFFDRDDADISRFLERFAALCAEHRLIVDYHGIHKPTGLEATYPNILNYEGVFGLENQKWEHGVDVVPADCMIPFTRALAGPCDYTPGAMLNYPRGAYKADNHRPGSCGTRCRQIALLALFDSPLRMLCDSPSNYRANPDCLRFMAEMPTMWDETRGLVGDPGRFCAVARRHGAEWWIAAISDWEPRTLRLPLGFLGDGAWEADIFEDAPDANREATHYTHRHAVLTRDGIVAPEGANPSTPTSPFEIDLAPGGGFAARLTPRSPIFPTAG